jgi:hypothetical protein
MYACSDRFSANTKARSSLGDGHTDAFVRRLVVRLCTVITLHIVDSLEPLQAKV